MTSRPHRRGKSRMLTEDLMKGEGKINRGQKQRAKLAHGSLGPRRKGAAFHQDIAGGEAPNLRKPKGLAIGTQEWAQRKIAEGDIEGGMSSGQSGTSIFDPVLSELVYRWFAPSGGLVLDPFAGGSVRGIVASKLGRGYLGVDLRPEQVAANQKQAQAICKKGPAPKWVAGDSIQIAKIAKGVHADFIFSCPPYADLEVYSDDPRDLSTKAYPDFMAAYSGIIAAACGLLKADRFACFVIGDARGKEGMYYGLVADTIKAFQQAGLELYNQAILVTACGSLPIRVRKQFEASRKLGNTHQHCLVFCKGDPVKATKAIGPVEFGQVDGMAEVPAAASAAPSQPAPRPAPPPDGGDPALQFGRLL